MTSNANCSVVVSMIVASSLVASVLGSERDKYATGHSNSLGGAGYTSASPGAEQVALANTFRWTWTGTAILTRKNGSKETITGSGEIVAATNDSNYANATAYNQMCTIVERVRNIGEQYTCNVRVVGPLP